MIFYISKIEEVLMFDEIPDNNVCIAIAKDVPIKIQNKIKEQYRKYVIDSNNKNQHVIEPHVMVLHSSVLLNFVYSINPFFQIYIEVLLDKDQASVYVKDEINDNIDFYDIKMCEISKTLVYEISKIMHFDRSKIRFPR